MEAAGAAKLELGATGQHFELPDGEVVIGRSRGATLTIDDPSVSRRHARLTVGTHRVTAADLGSANGTFLNGHRLDGETVLRDGDRLTVGETELVVRIGTAEPGPLDPPTGAETVRFEAGSVGGGEPAPAPGAQPNRGGVDPGPQSAAATPADRPAWPATEAFPVSPSGRVLRPADSPVAGVPARERGAPSAPSSGDREPAAREAATPGAAETRPPGELLPSIDAVDLASLPPPRRRERAVEYLPAAGFWIRLGAAGADAAVVFLGAVALSLLAGGPRTSWGGVLFTAAALALSALVPLAGWTGWGTTPGKRLFRLYVCPVEGGVGIPAGRALARWLGYGLSWLTFGLGFAMVGFTAAKRGLHDLVGRTYVGRRG